MSTQPNDPVNLKAPNISADEFGCATLEWICGERKITLYTVSLVDDSLLKVWGANMDTDMEFVPVDDVPAVRAAFKWLVEEQR